MNIKSTIGDYETFLDKIFENLKKHGFSLDEFKELDHIAYRTEDIEKYEEMKKELINFSKDYNDKVFNGRNILVCRLKEDLIYKDFKITGFELLAPKEGNNFKNGLEHAEFVIKGTLEEFKEKHCDIDFNLSAYDRDENPELCVNFENCAAKFHEQSLLDIRNI